MITRKFQILSILLVLFSSSLVYAADQTVFSGKVIRIEPWMPIKITCGVALVTRLAEYEVRTVYRGAVESRRIIVRHLACNGDELDNLNDGDEVLVVATRLRKPEKYHWRKSPIGEEKDPPLLLRYDAVKVAKQIYPTQTTTSKP